MSISDGLASDKMPVKSAKQFRLMEAAAHGGLRGSGPSKTVAEEFLAKTPHKTKSRFAELGRKIAKKRHGL